MKKFSLAAFILLNGCFLYSLPVGNPAGPSLLSSGIFLCDACDPNWYNSFSFRAGFYGDYVFNRHLKTEDFTNKNLDYSKIATNAALVTFNICDRFDIFTTLGTSNFTLNANASLFTLDPEMKGIITQIETSTEFSWSVGARATLWRYDCTLVGIEGQYFSTHPDIYRITNAESFAVYPANTDLAYQEWQIGVGLTQSIAEIAFPYVAIKYANVSCSMHDAEPYGTDDGPISPIAFVLPQLKSAKHIGYAVGLSLVYFDAMSINLEGRFADEKAFDINAQIRF